MIVRILEDGQYKVDKSTAKKLDNLDTKLGKALDKSDEAAFARALASLVKTVHASGKRLDPSVITPSDLAIPAATSTLAEVRELLASEAIKVKKKKG
ncbi:MAG TPA: hypothetical protein VED84_02555 [Acidimicrobiales bacterium]|nr:hypothetical protein [Acidimicrobiales bacterium]